MQLPANAAADEDRNSCVAEVVPGLFVGSLRSLGFLGQLGITHVLSAVNFKVTKDLTAYQHLHLPLCDDEDANLLSLLPEAYTFIHAALHGLPWAPATAEDSDEAPPDGPSPPASTPVSGMAAEPAPSPAASNPAASQPAGQSTQPCPFTGSGGSTARPVWQPGQPGRVLVHCQAGQSRSVAVLAAYLMKARSLSADQALARVREAHPAAQPNEGFTAQLELFADMRYSLDPEHPVFRMWRLRQVGLQWEDAGWVDPDTFAPVPEEADAMRALAQGDAVYRCRKCGRVLLTDRHCIAAESAGIAGRRLFRDRKSLKGRVLDSQGRQDPGGCSSLFTEPLDWMAGAVVHVVQGKLYCPGCAARLGSFNWAGITNERGFWITPAFQLHCSKLDVQRPLAQQPAGLHIARPLARQLQAPGPAVHTPTTPQPPPPDLADLQLNPQPTGPAAACSPSKPELQPQAQVPHPQLGVCGEVAGSSREASPAPGLVVAGPGQGGRPAAATAFFHTLLLDCDGVLVDTERSSCEALRRAILQVTGLDIPHSFPEDFYPVFGMDVRSCLEHYQQAHSRTDWSDLAQLATAVTEAKEVHYAELTGVAGIVAFPGAAALIQQASALGMAVAVASSGAPPKLARNLAVSGLAPLLDPHHIVSAAYVSKGKPAPDVYLEAMRRVACNEARRAVVVEDAVNGLKAGRAAGAFTIGITNSLPAEKLAPWADLVVTQLSEIDLSSLTPSV